MLSCIRPCLFKTRWQVGETMKRVGKKGRKAGRQTDRQTDRQTESWFLVDLNKFVLDTRYFAVSTMESLQEFLYLAY